MANGFKDIFVALGHSLFLIKVRPNAMVADASRLRGGARTASICSSGVHAARRPEIEKNYILIAALLQPKGA